MTGLVVFGMYQAFNMAAPLSICIMEERRIVIRFLFEIDNGAAMLNGLHSNDYKVKRVARYLELHVRESVADSP
ncbi:hypothetical protein TNCV_2025641 [Trichonephila clavipes]|nr:hypothetical protein TNCV_2025641 [Trichonephila clavipes]